MMRRFPSLNVVAALVVVALAAPPAWGLRPQADIHAGLEDALRPAAAGLEEPTWQAFIDADNALIELRMTVPALREHLQSGREADTERLERLIEETTTWLDRASFQTQEEVEQGLLRPFSLRAQWAVFYQEFAVAELRVGGLLGEDEETLVKGLDPEQHRLLIRTLSQFQKLCKALVKIADPPADRIVTLGDAVAFYYSAEGRAVQEGTDFPSQELEFHVTFGQRTLRDEDVITWFYRGGDVHSWPVEWVQYERPQPGAAGRHRLTVSLSGSVDKMWPVVSPETLQARGAANQLPALLRRVIEEDLMGREVTVSDQTTRVTLSEGKGTTKKNDVRITGILQAIRQGGPEGLYVLDMTIPSGRVWRHRPISVEDDPTYLFVLDPQFEERLTITPSAAGLEERRGPIRILYVEDDRDVQRRFVPAIEGTDVKVTVASTLAAARRAIKQQPFDGYIFDWFLENGSGPNAGELLGFLAEHPEQQRPILILSGDAPTARDAVADTHAWSVLKITYARKQDLDDAHATIAEFTESVRSSATGLEQAA